MTVTTRRSESKAGARSAVSSAPSALRAGALAALAALAVGCSGNPPPGQGPGPAPEEPSAAGSAAGQFEEAVAARRSGDVDAAASRLRSVWLRCRGEPLGGQAFLLLAATRLDPRYGGGTPDSAAAEAAAYLSRGEGPPWLASAVESLYLVARDLGGSLGASGDSVAAGDRPAPADDCGARWSGESGAAGAGGALPVLPGRPLRERLRTLQGTVDSLRAEVERLRELLKGPPDR